MHGARINKLRHADSTNINHADMIIGITITSALFGEEIVVQKKGDIKNTSWLFDLDESIFFNSFGNITQTPPSVGFSQKVGIPVSSDTLRMAYTTAIVLF